MWSLARYWKRNEWAWLECEKYTIIGRQQIQRRLTLVRSLQVSSPLAAMSAKSISIKYIPSSMPASKPLRPPGSRLGNFMWRCKMWIWTTFAFSMLEPWEIMLLCTCPSIVIARPPADIIICKVTIFSVFFILVITGLFRYLPLQLVFMKRRAAYYLWGQEVEPLLMGIAIEWIERLVGSGSGAVTLLFCLWVSSPRLWQLHIQNLILTVHSKFTSCNIPQTAVNSWSLPLFGPWILDMSKAKMSKDMSEEWALEQCQVGYPGAQATSEIFLSRGSRKVLYVPPRSTSHGTTVWTTSWNQMLGLLSWDLVELY